MTSVKCYFVLQTSWISLQGSEMLRGCVTQSTQFTRILRMFLAKTFAKGFKGN